MASRTLTSTLEMQLAPTSTIRTNSATNILEVAEFDKAGNLRATYVESGHQVGKARIDIMLPTKTKGLGLSILDIFLPAAYPHSVTDDYTSYQVYDSLQAFAGTIAGMISSRAVWEGIGVGDASASPTGAMLVTVVRECMGRLATILFAHTIGTAIEAECKMFRLASDIFCDTAMVLDALSPIFPATIRFGVLCMSSILFSAAGVAGNSSKSSLSAHFALRNNLGELVAKDGSQETAISLVGMMFGTLVVSWLSTPIASWSALLALLAIHLVTNQKAVRAVKMRTLSRQRANIVLSALVENDQVLTLQEVSNRERIFERRAGGILRWNCGAMLGHCSFGATLPQLLKFLPRNRHSEGVISQRIGSVDLSTLFGLFENEQYILWGDETPASKTHVLVVLKEGVTPRSQLKAWYQALLLSRQLDEQKDQRKTLLAHVASTLDIADRTFYGYAQRLSLAGWNLDIPVLETFSGSRIVTHSNVPKRFGG